MSVNQSALHVFCQDPFWYTFSQTSIDNFNNMIYEDVKGLLQLRHNVSSILQPIIDQYHVGTNSETIKHPDKFNKICLQAEAITNFYTHCAHHNLSL